jgi:hypothetical protein
MEWSLGPEGRTEDCSEQPRTKTSGFTQPSAVLQCYLIF